MKNRTFAEHRKRIAVRMWCITNGQIIRNPTTDRREAELRAHIANSLLSPEEVPFTVEELTGELALPADRWP